MPKMGRRVKRGKQTNTSCNDFLLPNTKFSLRGLSGRSSASEVLSTLPEPWIYFTGICVTFCFGSWKFRPEFAAYFYDMEKSL